MKIIIVSNRLPINLVKDKSTNTIKFEKSSGGLATSVASYTDKITDLSYLWVGWSGLSTKSKKEQDEITNTLKTINCYPIFLSEKEMDKFYLGFCNKTIWPLFHYFPTIANFESEYYSTYFSVNEKFAKTLSELINPKEDIVWVHDYHLMLLPKMLRDIFGNLPIGFFLHIPFPAYEVFQLLPSIWRKEILNGLLGADLISFHTHEYANNFLQSVLRFINLDNNFGEINVNNRFVRIATHPISIDFLKFNNAYKKPEIAEKISEIKDTFNGKKILFSVDRLDYTKGIPNRLLGFEYFLNKYHSWHGKIVLVIVVVPSRIGLLHYQQMKKNIDEIIGRINGKFSNVNWTPIIYKFGSLDFKDLTAFYNASDVMLVTPLRDGMNLVAKEYVASRSSKDGVLILSEMAGSAKELLESIIINPNSTEEIGEAIKSAIEMQNSEQIERMSKMQERISRYNVFRWVSEFLNDLNLITLKQNKIESQFMDIKIANNILKTYNKSKHRLLFFDYDGTLVEFYNVPHLAKPADETLRILKDLSKNNKIVIISGRDKNTLSTWFKDLDVDLIAEHGAFYQFSSGEWQTSIKIDVEWKKKITNVLQVYNDRLPGSIIEEKAVSLVFHYRSVDPDTQTALIPELIGNLQNFIANTNLKVFKGNKILEIKDANIGKHNITNIYSLNDFDFIMALGDDYTDEDMFKVLPENSITIKVGDLSSIAKYKIKNPQEVINFLKSFIS